MKWTVHEITGTERTSYDDEYETHDAELGEPSVAPASDCVCDCVGIAEELADIKAMIGRLIRNGGDAVTPPTNPNKRPCVARNITLGGKA